MSQKIYITSPIYYVNDVPHIGHAYTTLAADILARYWKEKIGKDNVFFLTGTDEHGLKVQQAAEKKGLSPQKFADSVAPRFIQAWRLLNIKPDYFIRTTNLKHQAVVTKLLQKIYDADFIYKDTYKGLYCVDCEKFLTESELVNNKCPLHPNKNPIYQEEENWFLKLEDLSKEIYKKIKDDEYKIRPAQRKHEVLSRLELGAENISISRAGVPWGIPLPWDKSQTIYVWVDALINYYSATQFLKTKKRFWPADIHLLGKDILWFHSVIWPALLLAAGIELPKTIFAHGFFTIDGQKMSKSLGNVISPKQLTDRYSVDGARYLLTSAFAFGADGDISFKNFDKKYNADLANGLGNLVARIAAMVGKDKLIVKTKKRELDTNIEIALGLCGFDKALNLIWGKIKEADVLINEREVWKLKNKEREEILAKLIGQVLQIAADLKPFLPETAKKIEKQFQGPKIKRAKVLFPRLD